MLCGIYKQDSGKITIFDQDLKTRIEKLRPFIGFCPQQSILYDDLTVFDHLNIIASVILGFLRFKFMNRLID
jgi:ABC-type multidrug transport system ATPase subunit